MSLLSNFFNNPVDHGCYYDPADLDTLRLVSSDTKEAVTQDHVWSSFARSVGCDFLHSRDDVKGYFADLKKVAKGANNLFFPSNQSEFIGEMEKIRNKEKYATLQKAPTKEEIRELQTVRENVDIEKIWDHLFGNTNNLPVTNRYLRRNFDFKLNKLAKDVIQNPEEYLAEISEGDSLIAPFDGKHLSYFPPILFKMPLVKGWNLSNNEFRKIPEGIEKCQNLKSLDLSGNQIERVPVELAQLTNLQTLDLRNNAIQEVPYEVRSMPNCIILTDGNPLAEKRKVEGEESAPKRRKLEEA